MATQPRNPLDIDPSVEDQQQAIDEQLYGEEQPEPTKHVDPDDAETAWLQALEECDRAIDAHKKDVASERNKANKRLGVLEKQRAECLDELIKVRAGTSDRLPGF